MPFTIELVGLKSIQNKARKEALIDEPMREFFEDMTKAGIAHMRELIPVSTGALMQTSGGFVDSKTLVPRFGLIGVLKKKQGGVRYAYLVQVNTKHGRAQPFVRPTGEWIKGYAKARMQGFRAAVKAIWATRG